MTADNDNVIPLHESAHEEQAVMEYLQRWCDAHGWDLDDLMKYGPPLDSYQCLTCGTLPLYWHSGAFTQLDGRIIHKACGRSDTIHHRHEPTAVVK